MLHEETVYFIFNIINDNDRFNVIIVYFCYILDFTDPGAKALIMKIIQCREYLF